jgi:hypothetical protein
MVRYKLVQKISYALKVNKDGMLLCPNCVDQQSYLHPEYVGIAHNGDMEKLGFSQEIGEELTSRHRDKLVTLFSCEMCAPVLIARVEVNHKGLLFSGVYSVNDTEMYEKDLFGDGKMMDPVYPENKLMNKIYEQD